jgi:hypothetical protein
MLNHQERDGAYINHLESFMRKNYHIDAISVTPAKRGYYGETWRLETVGGCYFIKLDYFLRHQNIFKNSLSVVEYLCNSGIDFVGRIVKTCDGGLYCFFNGAVAAVFEWIDGENIETDGTKTLEYQMLCKIYPLTKPGFKIPVAEFSNNTALRFYEKWAKLKETQKETPIDTLLKNHSERLSHYAKRLEHLAYITHGDAGGNFLVGNGEDNRGRHYIVDWDEVMYAPLERDAWVMCHRDCKSCLTVPLKITA